LSPAAFASDAAAPGVAVAVNVTGDPVAPLNVALAVCEPETVPSVQALAATPFASVTADVGFREAPAVPVDQVTVEPAAAVPPSVTDTLSGCASACPTTAVWASPLLAEAFAMAVVGGVMLLPPPPPQAAMPMLKTPISGVSCLAIIAVIYLPRAG
jgi:hypothetical protein